MDNTTPLSLSCLPSSAFRVVANPANPREVAVVALSMADVSQANPVAGINMSALGTTITAIFGIAPAPPPPPATVTLTTVGPEQDPPSWAL